MVRRSRGLRRADDSASCLLSCVVAAAKVGEYMIHAVVGANVGFAHV